MPQGFDCDRERTPTVTANQTTIPNLTPADPNWNPNHRPEQGQRALATFVRDRDGSWRCRFNIDDDALFEQARAAFIATVPPGYRKWIAATPDAGYASHWHLHPEGLEVAQAAVRPYVTINVVTPEYLDEQPPAPPREQAPPRRVDTGPSLRDRVRGQDPADKRDVGHEDARQGHPDAGAAGSKDAYRLLALRKDYSVPIAVVEGVAQVWRTYWATEMLRATSPEAFARCKRKAAEIDVALQQVLTDHAVYHRQRDQLPPF